MHIPPVAPLLLFLLSVSIPVAHAHPNPTPLPNTNLEVPTPKCSLPEIACNPGWTKCLAYTTDRPDEISVCNGQMQWVHATTCTRGCCMMEKYKGGDWTGRAFCMC